MRVVLDGEEHLAYLNRVSARDVMALREAIGMPLFGLARRVAQEGMEIDSAAAVAWLARRQNGEPDLTFEEVAADITFGSLVDTVAVDNEAEDSPPE